MIKVETPFYTVTNAIGVSKTEQLSFEEKAKYERMGFTVDLFKNQTDFAEIPRHNKIHTGEVVRKHNHYFKPCPHDYVDVYRVLKLFNVTDPCLGHALKKILVAGGRGAGKDVRQDVQEAIDTLTRWQEMAIEDLAARTTDEANVAFRCRPL